MAAGAGSQAPAPLGLQVVPYAPYPLAFGRDGDAGFHTQSMRKKALCWQSHLRRHCANAEIEPSDFTGGLPDEAPPLDCAPTPGT